MQVSDYGQSSIDPSFHSLLLSCHKGQHIRKICTNFDNYRSKCGHNLKHDKRSLDSNYLSLEFKEVSSSILKQKIKDMEVCYRFLWEIAGSNHGPCRTLETVKKITLVATSTICMVLRIIQQALASILSLTYCTTKHIKLTKPIQFYIPFKIISAYMRRANQ